MRSERLALTIAVLILVFTLFVPPPVGVADDGDFGKVLGAFDVDPGDASHLFRYITVHYQIDPARHWWSSFPSSEMLLMIPALALNRLIAKPGIFDLRAMGAVHAALFVLALALYLPAVRRFPPLRRALLQGAAIFVFCDTMYVSYWNSVYMDAPALLFLLLVAVFFVRIMSAKQARTVDWIGITASAFLFATAKSQHALAALPIAAILFRMGRRRTAVLLAMVSLFWILNVPFDYPATARFNLIFYRILPQAPDRDRALAELGLDSSYTSKIGMYAYMPHAEMDNPVWVHRFEERATYGRLIGYYLRHPSAPLSMLAAGLEDAGSQRARLGNYDRAAGKPPGAQSYVFAGWSAVKQVIFTSRGWLYAIYCLTLFGLLPFLTWPTRDRFVGALALSIITLLALGIGCLGDALDYARHLFVFNACVDMLAMGCLASLLFRSPVQCL